MESLVKTFRQMVLVFFFGTETGTGLSCTITKYWEIFRFLLTRSQALVIPTNGSENFDRFGKNGKKGIPRKVVLFSRKFLLG